MGLLGKLLKTAIDVATIPVAVISDVATLGGTIIDKPSAIVNKVKRIGQDTEEIREEVDKL